jgi:hypothetical protein
VTGSIEKSPVESDGLAELDLDAAPLAAVGFELEVEP